MSEVVWQARFKYGPGDWFQVNHPDDHKNPESFEYRPLYLHSDNSIIDDVLTLGSGDPEAALELLVEWRAGLA